MFSRNSDKDGTRPVQPAAQPAAAQARQPMPSPATASGGTASVIGSDLTIVGSGLKIIAQQSLQVDGEVQGDVIGTQVTIGPTGKVTGLVNADRVQVNGTVNGTIRGQDVILSSTAAVEGDIFHGSIMLEQGASFEGRSRRPKDPADLKPNLSAQPARPVAAAQPASGDKPQPMAMANGATGAADNT
jgi:cytoskeletal protein CcmA (bactofilin family)